MEFVDHLLPKPPPFPTLPNDIWREITTAYREKNAASYNLMDQEREKMESNIWNHIEHIGMIQPYYTFKGIENPKEIEDSKKRIKINEENLVVLNRQIKSTIYIHNWLRKLHN